MKRNRERARIPYLNRNMMSSMIKIISSLFLSLIILFACTTSRKMSENQKEKGHFRLYSHPLKVEDNYDKSRYTRIGFAGTNDFNGNIYPKSFPIENRFGEPRSLQLGGIAALKSYLDILKDHYNNNFVYVDAGSFLHKRNHHLNTMFLFNYLATDAAGLGLNEFTIEVPPQMSFKKYLGYLANKSKFNILNSNLFDLKTTENIDWKGISEHHIKEVNGVKIGFISIITPSLAKTIPDNNINGIYIQNPAKKIILKSKELRRQGVQIIALLANTGIDCTSMKAHELEISEYKVNFDPTNNKICNFHKNELYEALSKIPARTIDLVFTSGINSKVANFILDYPVVQNYGKGDYLSWVEIYFDNKHNAIDRSKTIIKQPILLCHQFLKDSQDCFHREDINDKELIPAWLLGKKVLIKNIPLLK